MLYAEIAVHADAPYRHPFTYSVPSGLSLTPGQGVLVPFGPRTLQGIVLTVSPTTTFDGEVRPLLSVATELPLVLPHLVQLARWLAERYVSPLYPCVALMLPPGIERRTRVRFTPTGLSEPANDVERSLTAALRDRPSADLGDLQRELGVPRLKAIAERLVRRGALRREYALDSPSIGARIERRLRLLPAARDSAGESELLRSLQDAGGSLPLYLLRRQWTEHELRQLTTAGLAEEFEARLDRDPLAGREVLPAAAPVLTTQQLEAADRILAGSGWSAPQRPRVTLLHGVTGSGKTEVYLAAAAATVSAGRRAIVLVPEIALTPQTVDRFAGRFPGRVAVLHSALSVGQRYDQWCGVRDGRFDIVVGSRSALFSPVSSLGLIIMDEEHEWTYKQQDVQPRYQTRDVAERLAALAGTPLILGSATPSVTSYQRTANGRYHLVELPERVRPLETGGGQPEPLPVVQVVDLARELREGNRSIFSRALDAALDDTLARREQAILFLNRRGSASLLLCRDCGHVPRCSRCAVSLTFHAATQRLLCHQCGRSRRAPTTCPRCRGGRIRCLGVGTQRVVDEVTRRFPTARVLRWDHDTTRRAQDHADLFDTFRRGEADVLVGTQMVAKGLDLPGVTLVGIVNADMSLNLPEYYSGERAFQLLTQVAGRAGRRERPGLVILQTYAPNHYAVRAASAHNYAAFYRQEIDYRRRGGYPPFSRLTRLVYAHTSQLRAEAETRRMANTLRQLILEGIQAGAEVMGPVPCRTERLRGRWRWQLLIRGPRPQLLLRDLQFPAGWVIDVDPETFS